MKTLTIILAALLLSSCAWIGKPEPTPLGGVLTETEGGEVYVGPIGSAWTYQIRYVLDDDAEAPPPQEEWTIENAPRARVRVTIPVE